MARNEREGPFREANVRNLAEVSDYVGRVARELAELAKQTADVNSFVTARIGRDGDMSLFARRLYKQRRQREVAFGANIFGDPAWDMLLDLFIAHEEKRDVSASSLCIAATVPPTTALRWIKALTDNGMFVRRDDPLDGRRVFIELAPHIHARMYDLLRSWRETTRR